MCECALGRERRQIGNKFTCLLQNEIQQLEKLLGKSFKQLYKESNCQDDLCIYKYVKQLDTNMQQAILTSPKYKIDFTGGLLHYKKNRVKVSKYLKHGGDLLTSVDAIFQNAIPPETDIPINGWLDGFIIDTVGKQIQANQKGDKVRYVWKGVQIYEDFEGQGSGELDVKQIAKNIQKNEIWGYVLNVCHSHSPGQHWVSMAIYRNGDGQVMVIYYDSQKTTGPVTGLIKCDTYGDSPPQYVNYYSKFYEWYPQLKDELRKWGLKLMTYPKPQHNDFIGQGDTFSCGYHALYFQFLISNGYQSLQKIHDLTEVSSTTKFDKFMQEFQTRIMRR